MLSSPVRMLVACVVAIVVTSVFSLYAQGVGELDVFLNRFAEPVGDTLRVAHINTAAAGMPSPFALDSAGPLADMLFRLIDPTFREFELRVYPLFKRTLNDRYVLHLVLFEGVVPLGHWTFAYVFDTHDRVFVAATPFAEDTGSEGAENDMQGWLVDLDANGQMDVLTRRYERRVLDVRGKVSKSDTFSAYAWTANGFRPLTLQTSGRRFRRAFPLERW